MFVGKINEGIYDMCSIFMKMLNWRWNCRHDWTLFSKCTHQNNIIFEMKIRRRSYNQRYDTADSKNNIKKVEQAQKWVREREYISWKKVALTCYSLIRSKLPNTLEMSVGKTGGKHINYDDVEPDENSQRFCNIKTHTDNNENSSRSKRERMWEKKTKHNEKKRKKKTHTKTMRKTNKNHQMETRSRTFRKCGKRYNNT